MLSAAFDHVQEEAHKRKDTSGTSRGAVILLVDEADAIAQSREAAQMHHEDRAGVNAFIRGIDRLANSKLPAAVIMCTNRIGALTRQYSAVQQISSHSLDQTVSNARPC